MRRLALLLVPIIALAAGAGPTEDEVLHFLPFPAGMSFPVLQGNDQSPSHNDEYNRYAFDFSPMRVGTEIVATAGGKVTFVRETTTGPTGDWRDNNIVAIAHGDGTVGVYEHLRVDGAVVEVGDVVLTGDLIGYSGNTGNSTDPHLHFGLRVDSHMGKSAPCTFRDVADRGVPSTGDRVTSGNVAMRESVPITETDRALALYDFTVRCGCVEAALAALRELADVDLSGPQSELRDAAGRRGALAQRRESESTALLAQVVACRAEGDIAGAVRLALLGARDYAGTASEDALEKALSDLADEASFAEEKRALAPLLEYRRLVIVAVKHETKAAAARARVKPGRKPPARLYQSAIAAFGRARDAAPREFADEIETHIATLPTD